VVLFEILLDGAEPSDAEMTWLSSPVCRTRDVQLFCEAHCIGTLEIWNYIHSSFRKTLNPSIIAALRLVSFSFIQSGT